MKGFRVVHEPEIVECPYCGSKCETEWENTGSGLMQVLPFSCNFCKSVEIGAYDYNSNYNFDEDEKQTGWYRPGFDRDLIKRPEPDEWF